MSLNVCGPVAVTATLPTPVPERLLTWTARPAALGAIRLCWITGWRVPMRGQLTVEVISM